MVPSHSPTPTRHQVFLVILGLQLTAAVLGAFMGIFVPQYLGTLSRPPSNTGVPPPIAPEFQAATTLEVGLVMSDIRSSSIQMALAQSPKLQRSFNVYTDAGDPSNHYIPSGFMGDFKDITLMENWTANPHSGRTCIRVVYSALALQGNGWAGVYWQSPANNWGNVPMPTGYNLSQFSKLSFWVRGKAGGERVQFLVGGITGRYGDSLQPAVKAGVITLTTRWRKVTIDLRGKNMTHIIGGFGWVANKTGNPSGATFYLDDIVYSV